MMLKRAWCNFVSHPSPPSVRSKLINADMQLKIFMCSVGEEAELCFSLYHKEGRQVSEEYHISVVLYLVIDEVQDI